MFNRTDKKRGTYRVKESVHLNRPTMEPNRIRKQNGRRGSANADQVTGGGEWAVKRSSTQVLQLSQLRLLSIILLTRPIVYAWVHYLVQHAFAWFCYISAVLLLQFKLFYIVLSCRCV